MRVLNSCQSSGPLVARVPGVVGRAMREDALLGAALLLVAPGAAEGRVESAICRAPGAALRSSSLAYARRSPRRPARRPLHAVLIDMDEQIHAHARRRLVAKGDHLAEFPGGVDMQQRKRRLGTEKRPCAPDAASRWNPCRSNRASPAARIPPRPRA